MGTSNYNVRDMVPFLFATHTTYLAFDSACVVFGFEMKFANGNIELISSALPAYFAKYRLAMHDHK